jgi:LIVCS family branched-chain amino acid:cation transporter
MDDKKSPSSLVIGLALFSMFFGSGNLIFPLSLGAVYQGSFVVATCGFVITAVLLPTLGLLAMLTVSGNFDQLFLGLIDKKFSRWFFLLVLAFWIPFGSGPRCVILAHASINHLLSFNLPLWLFSILFLLIVFFSIIKRKRIIDLLGKVLTPLLLLSIGAIVISSFRNGIINEGPAESSLVFWQALGAGYYTQDLIAAIFFSSALWSILEARIKDQRLILVKAFRGSLVAVFLLAVLYAALMAASAIHGDALRGLSGEKLVSTLATIALGPNLGGLSSVAVSLACLTTEIALVIVFADFINSHLFSRKHQSLAIVSTLLITWAMSLLSFGGVMAIIAPAMTIIYPILVFLVLRLLWIKRTKLRRMNDNL